MFACWEQVVRSAVMIRSALRMMKSLRAQVLEPDIFYLKPQNETSFLKQVARSASLYKTSNSASRQLAYSHCLCVFVSLYLYLSFCLSLCLYFCLSFCLSVCLSVCTYGDTTQSCQQSTSILNAINQMVGIYQLTFPAVIIIFLMVLVT